MAKTILQKALDLPSDERAEMAAELLTSLDDEPGDSQDEVERAWAVEIERRARRVLEGNSEGVPWESVKRRIEAKLSGS